MRSGDRGSWQLAGDGDAERGQVQLAVGSGSWQRQLAGDFECEVGEFVICDLRFAIADRGSLGRGELNSRDAETRRWGDACGAGNLRFAICDWRK